MPFPANDDDEFFLYLRTLAEEKLFNFHVGKWEISSKIYGSLKVFSFSRAQFYYGSRKTREKWFIVRIGSISFARVRLRDEKSYYFGMDDETSCGKFDKKPFLIRFRNRKYPFLFRREGKTKSAQLSLPKCQYILTEKAVAMILSFRQ